MLAVYTFWDVMWTMIVFFIWVMFLVWVIMLMIDNFRRTDHSGWAKAAWALFIIFLPIIGAISYTVVRASSPPDYADLRTESGGTSTATELARLHDLRTDGAISDEEYETLKTRTIAIT
jgi:Phospholipase_D-nuclease N-terminal